jgi:hypothetical protein
MLAKISLRWLLVIAAALPCATRADEPPPLLGAPAAGEVGPDGCSTLALLEDACAPLVYLRGERVFEPLHVADAQPAPADTANRARRSGLSYHLGDTMTAGLSYRHSLLFGLSQSDLLRQQPLPDFRTDRELDSLKLQLSWTLPWSILDLGYRFDSARDPTGKTGALSLNRLSPEDGRSTHSLMLGVTREWGGAR